MQIPVVRNVLEANEKMAVHVRRLLAEKGILALNLISSPGAGKTTLLERTLSDLSGEFRMAVVEGDLQTDNDARRVAATGAQAVQIKAQMLAAFYTDTEAWTGQIISQARQSMFQAVQGLKRP